MAQYQYNYILSSEVCHKYLLSGRRIQYNTEQQMTNQKSLNFQPSANFAYDNYIRIVPSIGSTFCSFSHRAAHTVMGRCDTGHSEIRLNKHTSLTITSAQY